MRKLSFAAIPAALVALPAVAPAAPAEPDLRDGRDVLAAAVLTDPLEMPEHRWESKQALKEAERDAEPPEPETVAVPSHLQAIAECESGGDPTAIGGGGLYRGKYQFSVETWQAVGGTGNPAAAPEAEQDRRAVILYETSGPGQWPVCGQ